MNKLYTLIFLLITTFSIPLRAQIPTGASARYGLNGSAADASGNSNNGTLSGTINSLNRFGTASAAVSFIAVTSSGTLPASLVSTLQNDFSIGFWLNTSAIALTGAQWYSGVSLVDAEMPGQTDDWGISMIDGGKIAFGIGNPDMTIKSTAATYNNSAWHFVTATRNKAAGTIILYMDGAQVATTSGTSTNALSAPAVIGLGRSSAVATGNYTGALDDIIGYNRVLTATEVANMYASLTLAALPLQWLSFDAEIVQGNVVLQWKTASEINQDYFTVEASTDAIHFNAIARTDEYRYTDKNKTGEWYYRIKQTDKDGRYTYSKTIKVTAGQNSGIFLRGNHTTNTLSVVNNTQTPIRSVKAIDAAGRIVISKAINSNNASVIIDVSKLQPGYYYLQVDKIVLPFVRE